MNSSDYEEHNAVIESVIIEEKEKETIEDTINNDEEVIIKEVVEIVEPMIVVESIKEIINSYKVTKVID